MERIFRELLKLNFTDSQIGALVKMVLEYRDAGTVKTGPEDLQMCFECNIAPMLDKLEKDKIRKRKVRENEREKRRID